MKGEIVYNDDYDTMQFCDSTNWVSMSASGTAVESDPQVDTLTASKWCKANAGGTAIDCASTTVDASAAGSTGYVQFHTAGTLDAEDIFIWDKTNNRLGIGSTAPAQTLDVLGTFALTGAATMGSSLGVTGNFAINTNKFTVTAASGNTAIAGTLAVTGPVTGASFAGEGSALTALSASNLGSGTVPDARFPSTLPAISGANLTNLNASNLASGTVAAARLGTGTADSSTLLRGDSSWVATSTLLTAPAGSTGHVQFNSSGAFAGSASLFWDNSNSRLGIGTASPAYPLEVSGKAKSVTVLLVPGSGGAPTGTGSATYWNQGGTDLYYITGNVGIGTAAPSVKLDVVGSQNLSGNLSVGGTLNSVGNFSVATNKFNVTASNGNTYVAGSLGVGTTSPGYPLDVNGYALGVGTKTASSGAGGNVRYRDDTGTLRWTAGVLGVAADTSWSIYNNVSTTTPFAVEAATPNNTLYLKSTGNVGIGTATPAERLDVGGGNVKMGYEIVSTTLSTSGTVSCSGGKQVLGGGCQCTNGGGNYVRASVPNGTTGWTCYCDSGSGNAAYAICANMK